jgi:hypothetical protein
MGPFSSLLNYIRGTKILKNGQFHLGYFKDGLEIAMTNKSALLMQIERTQNEIEIGLG